ncbi:disease resistance protein RPV1-like [Rhodamnia argentea]|uniref:Disease resistance protein RPV1-like n=1 Tax=Rhodamnia argentea TaxID=178133 RepID=A0A8B8QH55_9MYRT|nr:disease resistance protein RPV1-like [Rhodamnia argentea]
MAFSNFQSSLSASASSVRSRYDDVVLSFRGTDTSRHFTNGLLAGLSNAGMSVFRDEKVAGADKGIDPTLVEAIEQSKISIPIISPDYASSESCLMGLVKMLECRDNMNHTVIPIFYGVDPSDIGSFVNHKKRGIDRKLLTPWKSALHRIGQLKGYHLDPTSDQDGRLISEVVLYVTRQLKNAELVGTSMPVGIDNQLRKMMTRLDVDYRDGQAVAIRGNEVRMVGIHGNAGIGKTTLAKFIYSQLYPLFEGCSYLGNIGEVSKTEPLEHLQSQLISDLLKQRPMSMGSVEEGIHNIKHRFRSMRVLIVLDDIHGRPQLEAFAGKLSWFGSRSRIIVTTRNAELLRDIPEMFGTYRVGPMEFDPSLCLFCRHAFGESSPRQGYEDLSKQIVSRIDGVPLVIEVLGSYLYRKQKETWDETLRQLKEIPARMLHKVLMTSYTDLNQGTKDIFLDIACFFLGKDQRIPFYMWEDCGFHPRSGIESLLLTSLVKIGENNELLVYDLLRDVGLEIVRNEDRANPGRRSRLWNHEDALRTLRNKQATKMVKALCLKYDNGSGDYFTSEEFQSLSELRFLKLDNANIRGDFSNLLSNLRWLDWRGCPTTFEAMNLHLEKLVILDLSWSKVTQDWEGWSQIEMRQLKVLNLTGCNEMLMTPDFSSYPQLEMLILERCAQLVEIHHSICDLKSLVSLNLKSCSNLSELPLEMGNMEALKELLIDGTSIQEIPESIARMKKLETVSASNCYSLTYLPISFPTEALSMLLLDNAKIIELPNSIGSLEKLERLSLRDCREIQKLPESLGELGYSLVELDVSGTLIVELPDSTSNLHLLRVLKLERCHVRKFPSVIGELRKLEEIHASHCRSLEGSIPSNIKNLEFLKILMLGYTCVSSLPESIQLLSHLQTLNLLACNNLETLPVLPSSLTCLRISSKKMSMIPDIQNLVELEDLSLGYEKPKELIDPPSSQSLGTISLPKLKSLELSHSQISNLGFEYGPACNPQLNKVVPTGANLQGVSGLPSSLSVLSIQACTSATSMPTLGSLIYLSELQLLNSPVEEIRGLGELKSLEILVVSHCPIVHLNGLSKLTSLMRLSLKNCESLSKLPNVSNLIMLRVLEIHGCRKICSIKGLEGSTSREEPIVTDCEAESSAEVNKARRRIKKRLLRSSATTPPSFRSPRVTGQPWNSSDAGLLYFGSNFDFPSSSHPEPLLATASHHSACPPTLSRHHDRRSLQEDPEHPSEALTDRHPLFWSLRPMAATAASSPRSAARQPPQAVVLDPSSSPGVIGS